MQIRQSIYILQNVVKKLCSIGQKCAKYAETSSVHVYPKHWINCETWTIQIIQNIYNFVKLEKNTLAFYSLGQKYANKIIETFSAQV